MPGHVFEDLATNRVDVGRAMETLDHAEMDALANMYTRWALTEPALDGDQRTKLIELSSDYEHIAAYAGRCWRATRPEFPPDAIAFVARLELKDAQNAAPSRPRSTRSSMLRGSRSGSA